jgi:hypothetical protein
MTTTIGTATTNSFSWPVTQDNVAINIQITATGPTGLTGPAVVGGPFEYTTATTVAPGPVSSISVLSASSSPWQITWNIPSTGTGPFTYNLSVSVSSGAYTSIGTATSGTSFSYSPQANVPIDIQITAVGPSGLTGPAAIGGPFTYTTAVTAPGAPSNVNVPNSGTTTWTVQWTAPTTGTTPFTYVISVALGSAILANTFTQVGTSSTTSFNWNITEVNIPIEMQVYAVGPTGLTGPPAVSPQYEYLEES